jgi:hypothetical protein
MSGPAPVGAGLRRPLPEHPMTASTAAPVAGRPPDPGTESAITRAALRACTIYPGPVGRLVCRELIAWADFGHRLGGDSLVAQLVREILAEPGDAIGADVGSPDAA